MLLGGIAEAGFLALVVAIVPMIFGDLIGGFVKVRLVRGQLQNLGVSLPSVPLHPPGDSRLG